MDGSPPLALVIFLFAGYVSNGCSHAACGIIIGSKRAERDVL